MGIQEMCCQRDQRRAKIAELWEENARLKERVAVLTEVHGVLKSLWESVGKAAVHQVPQSKTNFSEESSPELDSDAKEDIKNAQ